METPSSSSIARPAPDIQARVTKRLADFPWWVLFVLLVGALLIYNFLTNETYQKTLSTLATGIKLTIVTTISAFSFSIVLGLITAFGQMAKNVIFRNLAMLYVQIIRGIPVLVLIFYTALVIVPGGIILINHLGNWMVSLNLINAENWLVTLTARDVDFIIRGVIALAINYGAFSSEIFRAGIQSIEKGQIEAAKALGFSWWQTMRLVILPQAIRRILPPLGNDFISMLKESSLVSVLGVNEITQVAKKYSAASFLYPETYNTTAFLYLTMTLILSMGVKFMERRLKVGER
jgi:polar amino acid transport system permease protein